jgi:hypothetical protein
MRKGSCAVRKTVKKCKGRVKSDTGIVRNKKRREEGRERGMERKQRGKKGEGRFRVCEKTRCEMGGPGRGSEVRRIEGK